MIAILKPMRAVLLTLVFVLLTGNAASAKWSWKPSKIFSLNSTWPFRDKDEPIEGTPTRMACTWTDTVMTQPGVKPQRGFGGRITFYEKDEKKPILVDGQLVVYAFDETGRDPTDNKPTRRYVFPSEQMPLHMSKNEFGASYSFFLPWDEAGGPRTEVSLICRFQPTAGAVVASEQTRHLLPGSMAPVTADGTRQPPKVPEGVPSKPAIQSLQTMQVQRAEQQRAQQAIYETAAPIQPQAAAFSAPADASAAPPRQMTSTTINLPGSFQMPSAAAVMNAQPPAAGPRQPAVPSYQQPLPAQPAAQSKVTPIGAPGHTSQVQPSGYSPLFPAMPAITAIPAMTPPAAAVAPPSASYTTTPGGQTPLMQQQSQNLVQQVALQQQLLQQQVMQQQALQQRMLQQQLPVQQSAGQLPMQPVGAATVTYPTAR
jgi:hypothetical protein